MNLPIQPPFPVAEALSVPKVPHGPEWSYEPKWDGFRCLAFRDGAEIYLQSKAQKPLARYFPDVVKRLAEIQPTRFVLDGELLIPVAGRLSFEALQLRLHPAASRVARLSTEHPAIYVLFDLLVNDRAQRLTQLVQRERRAALEVFARRALRGNDALTLSPASPLPGQAREWFAITGGGLDGLIAKRVDRDYRSGTRDGMVKIKNIRTADCVVAGFRYASRGGIVGSLLLGLYDGEEVLHHVGYTAAIGRSEVKKLTAALEALARKRTRAPKGFTGRSPEGPSRWSTERTGEYVPLPPERVVEVTFDHFTGGRFRHGTALVRWRPDKAPAQCLLADVERSAGSTLALLYNSATEFSEP